MEQSLVIPPTGTASHLPQSAAIESKQLTGQLTPDGATAQDSPVSQTSKEIRLNPEQEIALSALLDFLADPDPESPFFTLKGYAGTGKTFIMREVLARSKRSHIRFAFTTPTNKAAKVLRAVTGQACTIYSLLGLRIEASGELKELVGGEKPADLSDLDVIVLDEASMANRHLFKLLVVEAAEHNLKIIFVGDAGQLPPVGEPESPVWSCKAGAELTQVMRHDNQILQLVTAIRQQINNFAPAIKIESNHSAVEGVWKCTKATFKQAIVDCATKGGFSNGDKAKVIAWRNVRVAEYNDLIRFSIFGAAAKPGYYLLGDRIVATAPCKRGEDSLMSTDDEAIVEGVADCNHPVYTKYKAIELKCRTEANVTIRLLVLHPDSQNQWDADCQELAHSARANSKLWKKFWELKDLFHQVKYAYAITAHRSQGSTYETAFVDYVDILYNRNRKEAFQCLYVACSRPTTKLILA